jgi:hypothetical protein
MGRGSRKLARPVENFGPYQTSCSRSSTDTRQHEYHHVGSHVITSEVSYDELLPEFRAITNISALIIGELVDSSQDSAFYRFYLGILPAIYIVGNRCRDR